ATPSGLSSNEPLAGIWNRRYSPPPSFRRRQLALRSQIGASPPREHRNQRRQGDQDDDRREHHAGHHHDRQGLLHLRSYSMRYRRRQQADSRDHASHQHGAKLELARSQDGGGALHSLIDELVVL